MKNVHSTWSQVGGVLVPTYSPSSWQGVDVVPGYKVSFQLISRCIILTTPIGIASVASAERVFELRNRFLAETIGEQAPFVEVRDFQRIPGLPDRAARRRQVDLYFQDALRCRGFIACNLNPMLHTMVRVGLLLIKSPFPYRIERDLESSVREALVLEQSIAEQWNDSLEEDRIHLDSWVCQANDFSAEAWVIAPSIFQLKASGVLHDDAIDNLIRMQERVLESGALDLTNYFRILDFTEVRSTDWSTRLRLSREMTAMYERISYPKYTYVCGANPWVRAAIWIFFAAYRNKVSFVVSEQDALLRIRNHKLFSRQESSTVNAVVSPQDVSDIQQLVQDIAQISWKSSDIRLPSVSETHRLYSVYEALRLVVMDAYEASEAARIDQERLNQAQATLDASLKKRSELIRVANHEIRAPLGGLMGSLEMLGTTPLSPESQTYALAAQRSASELQGILAKLVDFSSMETGRFELVNLMFNPHAMVRELEQGYAKSFQDRGIQFRCLEKGPLQQHVWGDQKRIQQILEIYLYNAGKFTASGSVEFSAEAQLQERSLVLMFSVRDTGMGIQPEFLDKVFEPFGRGDYGFAKQFGNIGLGLTIANHVAEILGATLSAQSEFGKGSCFTLEIELPLQNR